MSRTFAAVAALLCLSTIAGCASQPDSPLLTVRGSLAYHGASAPPPDTRALVEVKDTATHDGRVLAEQRIALAAGQDTVPFEIKVPRSKLDDGKQYAVRAAFHLRGRPTWVSAPVLFTVQKGAVDVGVLALKPYTPLAFASDLECGDRKVTIGFVGDVLHLTAGDQSFDMRPVAGDRGSQYVAVNDPSTTLHTQADAATIVLQGQRLPPCSIAGRSAPFRATGNEPGWRLDIDGAQMTLLANYGKTRFVAPTPPVVEADGARKYIARNGGSDIAVSIFDRPCADNMTGMPYPKTVVVVFDGTTLNGCGGDPAALFAGGEWIVESVTGLRFADGARATLAFGTDGKVAGNAPCNRYTAEYVLTGESFTIGGISATRSACDAQVQKQGQAFLEALGKVNRFAIGENGALLLHTSDQRTITARRG